MSQSWTDFNIAKEICKSLAEAGFENPLPIQSHALKASLLDNRHILGAAQTGSGKTIAYLIPLVNRILSNLKHPCSILKSKITSDFKKSQDFELKSSAGQTIDELLVDDDIVDLDPTDTINDSSCPEALILVPTRELAIQVKDEVDKICQFTTIKSCAVVGGLSQAKQKRLLSKLKPDIIIATPGRLYDLMISNEINHVSNHSIASIRTLVIDEADRMMQKGHYDEMIKIVDIIKSSKKYRDERFDLRMYLFSATLVFMHEPPKRLMDSTKKKNKTNIISNKAKTAHILTTLGMDSKETAVIDLNDAKRHGRPDSVQLTEYKINCTTNEKDLYLYYFLIEQLPKRIIVFCNSKTCLRRLTNLLKFLKISNCKLYGDMEQKKRLASLEKFRKSRNLVMVATDVAARGLDIKELDCVVHYQVPKICESYIHRSGRTARMNNKGISLTLCEPKEIELYKKLCNTINSGRDFDGYEIDTRKRDSFRERVRLAQECDKIEYHLRDSKSDCDWFSKAAKDCDIDLDPDDIRRISKGRQDHQAQMENAKNRRRLAHLQKILKSLIG